MKINIGSMKSPLYVLLDNEDIERVKKFTWYIHNPHTTDAGIFSLVNGKTTKLGRYVLDYTGALKVDHKDGDIFNNQKLNLRKCRNEENMRNQGVRESNTSGYKGVSKNEVGKAWRVRIRTDFGRLHLGSFDDIIEAAKAYDEAAKKYHKEFAVLNFPEQVEINAQS